MSDRSKLGNMYDVQCTMRYGAWYSAVSTRLHYLNQVCVECRYTVAKGSSNPNRGEGRDRQVPRRTKKDQEGRWIFPPFNSSL